MLALLAAGLLATASCGGGDDESAGSGGATPVGKVGVILPDTASSQRWSLDDPRYLKAAFDAAGVPVEIQNAQGDKSQFRTLADGMIAAGVAVLMIVNLDAATGRDVLQRAREAGIATIDYDRLTVGGAADYYVSFDNVAVGKLQGEGLVRCLAEKKAVKPVVAALHGSPDDNNAALFQQGYDSVLAPRFASGEYVEGPDEAVPEWDDDRAAEIFARQLDRNSDIGGVLAANDGLADAVISVLQKRRLAGQVPVTGQDATVRGLQNVLAGDQCMTVYKPIKQEADAAADLAISLAQNEKRNVAQSVADPQSDAGVPAVLLTPEAVYPENVKDVVADGFVTREALCTGVYARLCARHGVR